MPDTSTSPIWPLEAPGRTENDTESDSVTLVPAWQLHDARIADDAKAFWRRLRVLPPSVSADQRAMELCAAAYIKNELVGVSTISLEYHPGLRSRLGIFRCLVSPDHTQRRIAKRLTDYSRGLLENWSKQNPQEEVLGMAFTLESQKFELLRKRPVWRGTNNAYYWLIGYAPNGNQIRLTWFAHARVD
jgi:hypothetical protein